MGRGQVLEEFELGDNITGLRKNGKQSRGK
jgi:hypothetical protein